MADFFVRRLSVSERVRGGERRRGQARPATAGTDGGQGTGKSAAQLVPERLEKNESGVPMLKVYDVKNEKLETLSVEDYLPAVLAGEMAGDWPLEALKAQAILARTFVLQFVSQKESMYDGADISTDIKEAQAYDAAGVNARIREAVKETRGEVLNAGGELPYAWFHAHSGGLTARAKEGLDYEKAEPGVIRSASRGWKTTKPRRRPPTGRPASPWMK